MPRNSFKKQVLTKLNQIIMTQAELAASITAVKDQLTKASGEINDKITALTTALDNAGAVTPEVQEAIDGLKAAAQGLDDIVPDAPPTEEGGGTPPEGNPVPPAEPELPTEPNGQDGDGDDA